MQPHIPFELGWRRLAVGIAAVCCLALAAADGEPLPADPPPRFDAAELPGLLQRLGSQEFAEREQAEARLLELGRANHQAVLDWGMQSYVANRDPEVRHRLREVIRELVIRFLFNEKQGYLGLVLRPQRLPETIGDRLIYPMRISVILPQSTAVLGDLAVGDLVVQVDDQPFDRRFTYSRLLHYIRVRKPGDKLTVVVMRDGQPKPVEVTLGQAPETPNDEPVESRRQAFFETWFRGQYQQLRP